MPRKTDKAAIKDPFLDRRTKLIPCQKEMVKWWYNQGSSIHSLAKLFKVNRRMIQFILFPERQQKNLQDREARGGTMQYYNKDYHATKVREHRDYKAKEIKQFLKT